MEDLARIDWSKIPKNAVSISRRKVELMEAERKAPGANARIFLTRESGLDGTKGETMPASYDNPIL